MRHVVSLCLAVVFAFVLVSPSYAQGIDLKWSDPQSADLSSTDDDTTEDEAQSEVEIEQAKEEAAKYEEFQVVVKLDLASGVTIDEINSEYGTSTADVLLESQGIYLLDTPIKAKKARKQMNSDARLIFVELNYVVDGPVANASLFWSWTIGQDNPLENLVPGTIDDVLANPSLFWSWGGYDEEPLDDQYIAKMLGLKQAHKRGNGEGVVVAVIDTGVQADHPLLAGYVDAGYDFVDDDNDPDDVLDGIDDDGDGLIDESAGHGTHIAGIIRQVAPEARIMPIRVLNSDGVGNLYLLAEAIQYAVDNGADVINLSLGLGFKPKLLKQVINSAVKDHNVVVIAAAGNLDSSEKQYPAALGKVLAVGSVGPEGEKAIDSNYGEWVAVSAPGVAIYSAFPGDSYAWWSGTSMATPFASAGAALLLSMDEEITQAKVKNLLKKGAKDFDTTEEDELHGQLGEGVLNLKNSTRRLGRRIK